MKRSIMIVFAIFAISFSAVLWADDAQDIRDLIMKESTSCQKADVAAILSCYAPEPVLYWQFTDDPEDVLVWINGSDDLRKNYAEKMPKMDIVEPTLEIRHISIKGDKAVAVSRHWTTVNNLTMGTHHSMWMVSKIKGKWLITSAIVVKADLPNVLQMYAPKQ